MPRCLCRHLASRSQTHAHRGARLGQATSSEFSPRSNSTAPVLFVDGLSDSLHAFLEAEKRSRREVSVVINSVPTWLNTPHIGFVLIDVMGNAHCDVHVCGANDHKTKWSSVNANTSYFFWNASRELRNREQSNDTRSMLIRELCPEHANVFAGFEPPGCLLGSSYLSGAAKYIRSRGWFFRDLNNTYNIVV